MKPLETEQETDNLIEKRKKHSINDDDDDDDIAEDERLIKSTIVDDFKHAFCETKFAAPLILLLAIFLGYHMTVAPYKTHVIDQQYPTSQALTDLRHIRPVLSSFEQLNMQKISLRAESTFTLPLPSHDTISLRWHSSVNKYGNNRPPDFFYEGVVFGITSENSYNIDYTGDRSEALKPALKKDLLGLEPTFIIDRTTTSNFTDWRESGYAAYFSYADLKESGRISSDKLQPWKRIVEDVMVIARAYRQIYITVWYPKEFGKLDPSDPHKYINIVQQTLPTRTGLNDIKSTGVVWMSRINDTDIIPKPKAYKQEWSEEELMSFPSYRK